MGVYRRKRQDGSVLWYIDFYVDGKRVRERVGESKTQAKAVLLKRKGEVVSGKFQLRDARKTPLLSEFAHDYLAWAKQHKRSWSRDEHSLKHLLKRLGHHRLAELGTWEVEKYKSERLAEKSKQQSDKPVAPATVNRELSCLKRMYSLAIKWGKVNDNPAKNVQKMREREGGRRLTTEEKEHLLRACSEELRPFVLTAMQTGRRLSELLNLKWSEVAPDFKSITIREQKNGETQVLPVSSLVQSLLAELPRRSEWVFSSKEGGQVKSFRTAWENAVERAKLGRCRFHDLRHTWASEMGEHTDLRTLMMLGGWKRIEMPMRYVHPNSSHARECLEKLAGK
ncbi:site-specific integrase [candidate division KSB1 bacterium]|nr:site-specific integrase [candidate division KSB1 bacterium]